MSTFTDIVSNITFTGEEARSAIVDPAYKKPAINAFHTIVPGLVANKKVAFLQRFNKITRKDTGQTDAITSSALGAVEKTWSPEKMLIWIKNKLTDLEDSFWIYAMPKGVTRDNISETAVKQFLIDVLQDAVLEDALRIAWFSDTTHSVVSSGSGTEVLTTGTTVADYTANNGFWNQIFAGVALGADPAYRYTISENAGSSYAAQALGAGKARTAIVNMIEGCDKRLKSHPDKLCIATDTMFDNLITELEGVNVSESFQRKFLGYDMINVRGVPVVKFDLWDRYIQSDFDTGAKWEKPHRAVMTTPQMLQIAMDDATALGEFDTHYEWKDREFHMRGAYRTDYMLTREFMVATAY